MLPEGACKVEPHTTETGEGRREETEKVKKKGGGGELVKDMPARETSIKVILVNAIECKYPQHCHQCPPSTQPHLRRADWYCGSQQSGVVRVNLCTLLPSELMRSPLPPSVQELGGYCRWLTSQDMAIMESQVAQPLWTSQRKMPHKPKLLLSLSLSSM